MASAAVFGTLIVLAVVGYSVFAIARAVRRARQGGDAGWSSGYSDDDGVQVVPGRAYVYKLQIGLGRSARGIQQRLEQFATNGDTESEAGLAALLQQSALELLRQKDSIRYAGAEANGPMSMTNAETKMNGLALAERSRFSVERVRSADGRVNRASDAAVEGREALELVLVTIDRRDAHAARVVEDDNHPRGGRGAAGRAGRGVARRPTRAGSGLDASRSGRFHDRNRRDDDLSGAPKPVSTPARFSARTNCDAPIDPGVGHGYSLSACQLGRLSCSS